MNADSVGAALDSQQNVSEPGEILEDGLADTQEVKLNSDKVFRVRGVLVEYPLTELMVPWAAPDARFLYECPVPVYSQNRNSLIGYASLTTEKSRVVASIAIDKGTPERLEIETQSRKLYPLIWTRSLLRAPDSLGRMVATLLEIQSIEITSSVDRDWPLPPLSESQL